MATEELIRVYIQEAKNNRAEYLKSGVLLFAELKFRGNVLKLCMITSKRNLLWPF